MQELAERVFFLCKIWLREIAQSGRQSSPVKNWFELIWIVIPRM